MQTTLTALGTPFRTGFKLFLISIVTWGLVGTLGACGGSFSNPSGASKEVDVVTPAYSVGGSVTGLTGSGFALQLNGTNSISPANGTFNFPNQVKTGSAYAVTVSTQPVDQTCTVSHGSGIMNDAAITNIVVTCSAITFQIGGTVTGLDAGQSFTLQNNGTDSLQISSNGPFIFPTPVAENGSFAVTVGTQASNQTCSVSAGSGTAIMNNVTTVAVVCANDSYPIGGTVTGLTGTQQIALSLNNGQVVQAVAAVGTGAPIPFTFSSPVAYGSSYAVAVTNMPANTSCTVNNGTGVMNDAPLTNIAVVCAPTAFQVSGTVSGLDDGQSFTLVNNGSDTLPISANGSFGFAAPVALNGTYSVVVGTQPANQTCSVTNGGGPGNLVIANVTNVSVVCNNDTYTVGGMVTGLTGTQQINLSLNNGQSTALVAAGANGNAVNFVFPTPVAYGSGFTVSVTNTPAGVSCSFSNFSAQDPTANVNNIAVLCSSTLLTVSGQVTGLAPGEQITLTNQAGNPVTLRANTGFSFVFPYNGGFNILVGTQPTTQFCAVSNGTSTSPYTATPPLVSVVCQAAQLGTTWNFGGVVNALTGQSVPDGQKPAAGLIQATDNKLYGVTTYGGKNGLGSVYQFDPVTNVETQLYSFAGGSDQQNPTGRLVQGRDGLLYGITAPIQQLGGSALLYGTVFRIDPLSGSFATLFTFTNDGDGGMPSGGLVQGNSPDDSFYGVTILGGASGFGTIFQLSVQANQNTGTINTVHAFGTNANENISGVNGPLLIGPDGLIYGTSRGTRGFGGIAIAGSLFQFDPATAILTVLHTFNGSPDGQFPNGSLTWVSGTTIFGTTLGNPSGSPINLGTIFSYDLSATTANAYTSISFPASSPAGSSEPSNPAAGLTLGNDGNLYGTSQAGGSNNSGTLYQYNPTTNGFTVLYSFGSNPNDGLQPASDALIASNGNIYGTAPSGGNLGDGVIFRY